MMSELMPFYNTVQSIYDRDHSIRWLTLFLDPALVYSCAYFEPDDLSLEQAQLAKLDLALGKCDLQPGQRLLDVGCGYGACSYRAASKYQVDVIALTLSESQRDFCENVMATLPEGSGSVDVRLQGWEEFDEPVDRIVSIGAFEHFGLLRHQHFFDNCRKCLPAGGRMLLHSIVSRNWSEIRQRNQEVTQEFLDFVRFIYQEIFPGGFLVPKETMQGYARSAGFDVERTHSLQLHYARTLETWAINLAANREAAIEMRSEEDFDRYMKYLEGCAGYFRSGHCDVCQFTCVAV